MKIDRVTVEVLETPVDLQYIAAGNSVSSNWHVLSRVFTDDGVQGIGFAVATRARLVKALAQTAQELGQSLVGMNVLEVEAARAKMEHEGGWVGPGGMLPMAIAILDIALWDAAGKILGQPLYRLLGGYRDRVRTYASDAMWYSLPLDILQQSAQHHVSQGYDILKLRLGHEKRPEGEVARVRAVQEAVGSDVQIMVDAAESWNEVQAVPAARALQDAGIVWLEDPVNHQNLAGLAHLAEMLDIPVAGGRAPLWPRSFPEDLRRPGSGRCHHRPGPGGWDHALDESSGHSPGQRYSGGRPCDTRSPCASVVGGT